MQIVQALKRTLPALAMANAINAYSQSPSPQREKALYEALQRGELSQQAFSALYEKMLSVQDEHLRTTQNKLEGFVDEVLAELTTEKKDKRKDRR